MSIAIHAGPVLSLSSTDLDRPLICYDNVFLNGTITTDSEDETNNGFANNAIDGGTYDFWKPLSLPAYIQVDLPFSYPVNFSAASIHSQINYTFQYWDGSAWQDLHSDVDADQNTHLEIFEKLYSNKFRFVINSSVQSPTFVANILLGEYVRIPKKFYRGHSPSLLNRKIEIVRNETELGLVSGAYTKKMGGENTITITDINKFWVLSNLNNINKNLMTRPFVFSWKPNSFPNDCVLAWLDNEISATNNGKADLMDINFSFHCNVGDI